MTERTDDGTRRRAAVELPSPGVRFPPTFLARLGRLRARAASARDRREGAGRAHLVGIGDEFLGYRPYRPGDDLRGLDWNLLARFDEPFVRVSRREATERWTIAVDTSASMGVGTPGKLQRAAEAALGVAAVGALERVHVEVVTTDGERPFRVERPSDLVAAMAQLEARRAAGDAGLAGWLATGARRGRTFLIGDLLDVDPSVLAGRVGRGRELFACALLAPEEFDPSRAVAPGAPARWVDAETGERLEAAFDARGFERYEQALERHLETWRRLAARHRAFFGVWSTAEPFERVVEQALGL